MSAHNLISVAHSDFMISMSLYHPISQVVWSDFQIDVSWHWLVNF